MKKEYYSQLNHLKRKTHYPHHTLVFVGFACFCLRHKSFDHRNRLHITLLMQDVTFFALHLSPLQLLTPFAAPLLLDAPHSMLCFYFYGLGFLQIALKYTTREGRSCLS
jgi:hypothetical protein